LKLSMLSAVNLIILVDLWVAGEILLCKTTTTPSLTKWKCHDKLKTSALASSNCIIMKTAEPNCNVTQRNIVMKIY